MVEATVFQQVTVTGDHVILKEEPTQFLWTAPHDEQIRVAEAVIAQLQATIAAQVAEQRQIIDKQRKEKQHIQASCEHTTVRLPRAAKLTTTLKPDVMFGSVAEGICLDCGAKVNCCPYCGSANLYCYEVGSWDNEFDYRSSALEKFLEFGGGFNFFDSGRPLELHRAICENPDCHKSWYWLEEGPDPMDNW